MNIKYSYKRYGKTYHGEHQLDMEEIKNEIEKKEMISIKIINID